MDESVEPDDDADLLVELDRVAEWEETYWSNIAVDAISDQACQ